jgi:hypothetical protein
MRRALVLLLLAAACAPAARAADRPFVIAPVVEGLLDCGAPAGAHQIHHVSPDSFCAAAGRDAPRAVGALLDTLEPGGPAGEVQVGYVLTLQLLALHVPDGAGGWRLDEGRIERALEIVRRVQRPVVLYLAANHFDSMGPVTEALAPDPRNRMEMGGGGDAKLDYFGYRIARYTLLSDAAIPVNALRFGALLALARRVRELPPAAQERIVAVALGGEIHHLFDDFAHGMGRYEQIRVTDYGPAAQQAFRAWLARKYGSIDALNAVTRERWSSFDQVRAPSGDVWRTPQLPHAAHYDGHAGGRVPVSGWIRDPGRKLKGLELWINGRHAAEVERGFNRLDVYRAIEAVDDPNVGFRHDVDFSAWEPGTYRLQLMARSAEGLHAVAETRVHVMGARRSRLAAWWERTVARVRFWLQREAQPLRGVEVNLDTPRHDLQVLYNPLARDWNAFRAEQVRGFMAHLFRAARDAGLPADKLYSHQILTRANSSWNADLFATDGSVDGALPWKQGFNTYGGAAHGEWIARFVAAHSIRDYGVPEFHPQQWKRPQVHREALELHRKLGARFVSPYYVSIASDRGQAPGQPVKALEIRPNNKLEGSDMLYQAIRELAGK